MIAKTHSIAPRQQELWRKVEVHPFPEMCDACGNFLQKDERKQGVGITMRKWEPRDQVWTAILCVGCRRELVCKGALNLTGSFGDLAFPWVSSKDKLHKCPAGLRQCNKYSAA